MDPCSSNPCCSRVNCIFTESYNHQFSSVQSLSHVQLFATPWTTARQASLSITSSRSLPKLISMESVMSSNHLILCVPFSSCLQSFLASGSFPMSQFFASGSQSIGASTLVLPTYAGLISFRIDWYDLLAAQGTLKSLLQHHSLKASILWHSAFFMVHLSHLYITTGKTISSVQFSRSVVSDSLRPHESQHARPPCPSPSPRVHSNSRPLSQ